MAPKKNIAVAAKAKAATAQAKAKSKAKAKAAAPSQMLALPAPPVAMPPPAVPAQQQLALPAPQQLALPAAPSGPSSSAAATAAAPGGRPVVHGATRAVQQAYQTWKRTKAGQAALKDKTAAEAADFRSKWILDRAQASNTVNESTSEMYMQAEEKRSGWKTAGQIAVLEGLENQPQQLECLLKGLACQPSRWTHLKANADFNEYYYIYGDEEKKKKEKANTLSAHSILVAQDDKVNLMDELHSDMMPNVSQGEFQQPKRQKKMGKSAGTPMAIGGCPAKPPLQLQDFPQGSLKVEPGLEMVPPAEQVVGDQVSTCRHLCETQKHPKSKRETQVNKRQETPRNITTTSLP